ncbi:MAG TPA: hypothetical protein VIY96_01210, partial [Thermoanaerobaculia bacterium]
MPVGGRRTFRAIRAAVLAFCAAAIPASGRAGLNEWTSIGPYSPGGNVRALAIDPAAPGTVYAGADGGIFKSVDSGATWGPVKNGLTSFTVFALAIDPSTHGTLYAGTNGGVFKSVDSGASWSARRTGLGKIAVLALAIDPSNVSTVYAGTATAGVFRSTDGGNTWIAVNNGLSQVEVRALAVSAPAPATIFAATPAGVFRSTDAGATWLAPSGFASSVRSVDVDPVNASVVYAGTEGVFTTSGVFKSTDGGATWEVKGLGPDGFPDSRVFSVLPTQYHENNGPVQKVLLAGVGLPMRGLYRSLDGGDTWRAVGQPPGPSPSGAAAPNIVQFGTTVTPVAGGTLGAGKYRYRITFVDTLGRESAPSADLTVNLTAGQGQVELQH